MSKEYEVPCRGATCGTRVLMREIAPNRFHPFDLPIPRCPTCSGVGYVERQAVRSMFEGGGTETVKDICKTCKGKGEKAISHFDTCPDADDYRTKKRGGVRATGDAE